MLFFCAALATSFVLLTVTSKGSPTGGASPPSNSSDKKSPPSKKKGLCKIKIVTTNRPMRQRIKVMAIALQNDVFLIFAESEHRSGDDAFMNPLHRIILSDNNTFAEHGLVCVFNRRVSKARNFPIANATKPYPRKVIVVTCEEGSNNHEHRMATLTMVCQFMSLPEHNQFSIDYYCDDSCDLSYHHDPSTYETMDHYVINNNIIQFIQGIYEDVGTDWYRNNLHLAHGFFSPPDFPPVAIAALGYPSNPLHLHTTEMNSSSP